MHAKLSPQCAKQSYPLSLTCVLPRSGFINLNNENRQVWLQLFCALQLGSCSSLTVLSMRDNVLTSLPMELGKLDKLRVLDVSANRLSYLPYTINALTELQALWLSKNQVS